MKKYKKVGEHVREKYEKYENVWKHMKKYEKHEQKKHEKVWTSMKSISSGTCMCATWNEQISIGNQQISIRNQ